MDEKLKLFAGPVPPGEGKYQAVEVCVKKGGQPGCSCL